MKKLTFILLIFILLGTNGCNKKEEIILPQEKPIEKEPVEPPYVDDNPIKISLYNINYTKQKELTSPLTPYVDIGVWSVALTEEEQLPNYQYKYLWNQYYQKYNNIDNYKIGYEISFKTEDGKEFFETITKPLTLEKYPFVGYLMIWLYDDINQTSDWYSHLEENEYTEKTRMTSIKLMATNVTKKITTPINITVFTYKNEQDFDPITKHYRGNSKFTLQIKK